MSSNSLETFRKEVELHADVYKRGLISHRELIRRRRKVLDEILDREGLAICSDANLPHHLRRGKSESEKLGLYPKSEIKLFYYRNTHGGGYAGLGGSQITDELLLSLCPHCYPEHFN